MIITYSRSSTIIPIMISYTISVHNGHEYYPILITDQMVGHKLGEFSLTRTLGNHHVNKALPAKKEFVFQPDRKVQ